MKVDFFLENEEGYAPKSFWDCYELIRAADNHPDTERLDWLATQDDIDITLSNVINLNSQATQEQLKREQATAAPVKDITDDVPF